MDRMSCQGLRNGSVTPGVPGLQGKDVERFHHFMVAARHESMAAAQRTTAGPSFLSTGLLAPYTVTMNIENDIPFRPSDPSEMMAPICSVFRRFLKSKGLKYTPERAAILDAIIDRDEVFEVEEILLQMTGSDARVSKATIYRTIILLTEAGIITQALFDSKQSHYRLIYGREPQDQMVCMRTGKLVEFTNQEVIELRNRICKELGWNPIGHRMHIYAHSPVEPGEESSSSTE